MTVQVIGQSNVSVPTHFFKVGKKCDFGKDAVFSVNKFQVIVGETEGRELEMEAFVLPNQKTQGEREAPALCQVSRIKKTR